MASPPANIATPAAMNMKGNVAEELADFLGTMTELWDCYGLEYCW